MMSSLKNDEKSTRNRRQNGSKTRVEKKTKKTSILKPVLASEREARLIEKSFSYMYPQSNQNQRKSINQASAAVCFCCMLIFPAICCCLLPLAAVCYVLLLLAIRPCNLPLFVPCRCCMLFFLLLLAIWVCCLLHFVAASCCCRLLLFAGSCCYHLLLLHAPFFFSLLPFTCI